MTAVAKSPVMTESPQVLSVRRYEAAPPANLSLDLVDPENTFATTKEEEWVTKKKTELTTTRQIETRVKRQVLLEDGKVVDDSGPIVTTNTTEDTEKQEHKQTEHRTTGDEPPGSDWVAIQCPGGVVKEVKERTVKSREKKEERLETEDVQHLGDISDDAYLAAIKSKQDIREVILQKEDSGDLVRAANRKIVHQSRKSRKVIDTEDSQQLNELQEDGKVVTETKKTTEHEEIRDEEEPDDVEGGHTDEEETRQESSHRYSKTKDQDIVEYLAGGVKIGEEMRYNAENVDAERHGDQHQEWDNLSSRIRRMRRQNAKPQARGIPAETQHYVTAAAVGTTMPLDRKDALTRRPLDFDQEEETRKVETSKWLENHFGSESRSSKDSIGDDDDATMHPGTNTTFINVTMKSRPISAKSRPLGVTMETPVNGSLPKGYTATVNSSSRVFVSSPEPERSPVNEASGFFQGVSEWSERRNDSKETKTYVTSPTHPPVRPERIQVLPSGPQHTFSPKSPGEINSPLNSSNHLDAASQYQNHQTFRNKTPAFQAKSVASIERSSAYHKLNSNHHNSADRISPYHQNSLHIAERSSPYQSINHNANENFPSVNARQTSVENVNSVRDSPPNVQFYPGNDIQCEPERSYQNIERANSPYHRSKKGGPDTSFHNKERDDSPYHGFKIVDAELSVKNSESNSSYYKANHGDSDRAFSSMERANSPYHRVSAEVSDKSFQNTESHAASDRGNVGGSSVRVNNFIVNETSYENLDRNARDQPTWRHLRAHEDGEMNGCETRHQREAQYRQWDTIRHQEPVTAEPPPDYSPPGFRQTRTPSPPLDRPLDTATPPLDAPNNKKLYQRTRFAADIPPPPARPSPPVRSKSPGQSATSIIGESFRKLVGKFRSSSSERKNKRRNGGNNKMGSSRSPSPRHTSSTYQQYHVIDNNIPSVEGQSGKAQVGSRGGGRDSPQPVAPPRTEKQRASRRDEAMDGRPQHRSGASPVVQRFYLGEDPFGGSIYGREREYDGVTSRRQRQGRRGQQDHINRENVTSSSTLGRLSKSTSRLTSGDRGTTPSPSTDYSRAAQTLPRKLYERQVLSQRNSEQRMSSPSHWDSRLNKAGQQQTGSLINVSIINNITPPTSAIGVSNGISIGPAKPARTYRSNLARSKSFNVHGVSVTSEPTSSLLGISPNVYKSNPHIHRLDESPPPLKSPGILASISRSQRDISEAVNTEAESHKEHVFSSNLINNRAGKVPTREAKKKLFMRGLMDRAPELFKTIHGDEDVANLKQQELRSQRLYSSTPVKNDRHVEYSNTASPPDQRRSLYMAGERVTSPVGIKSFTTSLNHTPSFRADQNGVARSVVRRGSSSNDDYSETVRITSKSDDPIRPSVTNTVQSFSKKTMPTRGGRSTETVESSETTTVTKSRFRGGDNHINNYAMRNGSGGVVIEVRPSRK